MVRIGLTGGIGSGKSLVANFFHELGVKIIDADEIAKELTAVGQPAYAKIVSRYGENILTQHQCIDRKKLREIIFNHQEEKKWLENLLHPIIKEQIFSQSQNNSSAYCIIVIPLLVETQLERLVDRVLVVDTAIETQINRIMARDNATRDAVINIIASQASRKERLAIADDVIVNNNDLNTLRAAVHELHLKYSLMTLC